MPRFIVYSTRNGPAENDIARAGCAVMFGFLRKSSYLPRSLPHGAGIVIVVSAGALDASDGLQRPAVIDCGDILQILSITAVLERLCQPHDLDAIDESLPERYLF
jgi:hypothetical protein